MRHLNKNNNHHPHPMVTTATICILAIAIIVVAATSIFPSTPVTATTTTATAAGGNTTTTSSGPSPGIKLSPQPIYQESSPPGNITPINQTHGIFTFNGTGMLTLPNSTQPINTTHNCTALPYDPRCRQRYRNSRLSDQFFWCTGTIKWYNRSRN